MADKLDQIIDISISLSTKTITTRGFGIPLIVGESMKLDRRSKEYSDISEVSLDFSENDIEYKMAQVEFSQEKTPEKIIIGKKVNLSAIVIQSVERVGSSGISAKRATIEAQGSNAEIGSTATIAGFSTTGYNGNIVVIERIDEDNFVVEYTTALADASATGSGTVSLAETWSNSIQNIYDHNADWYGCAISSTVEADILSAAAKIESLKRMLFVRSNDQDVKDQNNEDSVLYKLKNFSYDRTSFVYNENVSENFIDAAWSGRMLPTIPGSENWAFKTLKGVQADNLKSGESSAILNNNGNTFETFAGKNITRFGKVVSGEYIDIIRGADWLKARLQENIFLLLINAEKVPFDDFGIDLVENSIREVFEQGVANGFIAKNKDGKGIYTIKMPAVDDIPTIDVLRRLLSGVSFNGKLAGAINKVAVAGNLSV
jgi:hypothetical protein